MSSVLLSFHKDAIIYEILRYFYICDANSDIISKHIELHAGLEPATPCVQIKCSDQLS